MLRARKDCLDCCGDGSLNAPDKPDLGDLPGTHNVATAVIPQTTRRDLQLPSGCAPSASVPAGGQSVPLPGMG